MSFGAGSGGRHIHMTELRPEDLSKRIDVARLGITSTRDIDARHVPIDQDRAMEAVDFSVGMRFEGYNLYALGSPKTDKRTIIMEKLSRSAAEQTIPQEYCYLENFTDPSHPVLVSFPAGGGRHFKKQMQEFVASARVMIPSAFQSEEYRQASQALAEGFQRTQSQGAAELEAEAQAMGLAMLPTPNGFAFAPVSDGKVMEQEDFLALPEADRQRFQQAISTMTDKLIERLRDFPAHQQKLLEEQQALRQRTAEKVIRRLLARIRMLYDKQVSIIDHLQACEQAMLDNLDRMVADERQAMMANFMPQQNPEAFFRRFEVNLLVDCGDLEGAPVVYESNPSMENLVGMLEHRFEYGNPVTDFGQIRAGALHRANGGYLVLDAERVLQKPFAWEALKRALSDKRVRIESVSQMINLSYSVSLEPESVPLDVKIVLLGSRYLYHMLRSYDADFDELFKVVADFVDHVEADDENIRAYAALLASLVEEHDVLHVDSGGIGRILEQCGRAVEDRERLSTYVNEVRDLLLEADHIARALGAEVIGRDHVSEAVDKRIYRLDRFRELVRENIARGLIRIETSGMRVGQINGLSVVSIGQMTFGQPSRITATARLGHGELIDIERESKLGGNIHTKAVMIVSSFIGSRYARDFPLSLHASLVFEQSYAGVEGDSASIAEVCALLSAIADIPLRQNLAITGSMDQHGRAQAIGGVNEKIEGFFSICEEQGLTGDQGVIIPVTNTHHLMLHEDVVGAVRKGQFHIYTMESVDDAACLLLAGEDGVALTMAEIDERVTARLMELHDKAKHAFKGGVDDD